MQVIQAIFFGLCVLIDVSSLLTKGGDSREQERQLRKLIGLRDWIMAVLAFPVGAVSKCTHTQNTHNSCKLKKDRSVNVHRLWFQQEKERKSGSKWHTVLWSTLALAC